MKPALARSTVFLLVLSLGTGALGQPAGLRAGVFPTRDGIAEEGWLVSSAAPWDFDGDGRRDALVVVQSAVDRFYQLAIARDTPRGWTATPVGDVEGRELSQPTLVAIPGGVLVFTTWARPSSEPPPDGLLAWLLPTQGPPRVVLDEAILTEVGSVTVQPEGSLQQCGAPGPRCRSLRWNAQRTSLTPGPWVCQPQAPPPAGTCLGRPRNDFHLRTRQEAASRGYNGVACGLVRVLARGTLTRGAARMYRVRDERTSVEGWTFLDPTELSGSCPR